MNGFDALPSLHFLRPQWLWALLLLPLVAWWWQRHRRDASAWRDVVDPHLLRYLLDAGHARAGLFALIAGLLALALAVVALAGPAWRQVEQPVWQTRAPLVIALDLSSATLANDLPPSRLAQARAKLATLLRERAGGQVALVAYAGDAFTIAPLTDDQANVALFLDALAPDVMPVDGQRGDRAIAWSARLLERAGFEQGRILLLTDHADAAALAAATRAAADGYRVSALGLGTPQGAPYRDVQGRIGQARLDAASLRGLAAAGGGDYATLAADARDLRALGVLDPQQTGGTLADGRAGASWRDEGYWLLPPLMLLSLFAFRRRSGVAAALLLCLVLPARAAQAQGTPWRRADQVAHARMEQGAEAYRRGEFEQAADAYSGLAGADAHYNLGNALAKAGRYEEAIDAYDDALRRQPGMADAIANKRAVEAMIKRKPPQGGQGEQRRQEPQQGKDGKPGQQGRPDKKGQGQGESNAQPGARRPPSQPADADGQPRTEPTDAAGQAAAEAAQRERMQRALQGRKPSQSDAATPRAAKARAETAEERERRLANEAWLRRIPDDPGGLLRAKLRLEHERRQREGTD